MLTEDLILTVLFWSNVLNENPAITTKDEDEYEDEDEGEDKEKGFQFQLEMQGPRGKMGEEWEGRCYYSFLSYFLLSYLFPPS